MRLRKAPVKPAAEHQAHQARYAAEAIVGDFKRKEFSCKREAH